jgi:hypothetical protein
VRRAEIARGARFIDVWPELTGGLAPFYSTGAPRDEHRQSLATLRYLLGPAAIHKAWAAKELHHDRSRALLLAAEARAWHFAAGDERTVLSHRHLQGHDCHRPSCVEHPL